MRKVISSNEVACNMDPTVKSPGDVYGALDKVPKNVPLEGRYNGSGDFTTLPLHFLSRQGDYREDSGEQQVIKIQSTVKAEGDLNRKAGIKFPSLEMEDPTSCRSHWWTHGKIG